MKNLRHIQRSVLEPLIVIVLSAVFFANHASAQGLSLKPSASPQTAIAVTTSNPTIVGNNVIATVEIQNNSGTWIYIQQDLTAGANPVTLPYGIYLMGPGGTEMLNNITFTPNSYLQLDVTTPIGLDFTSSSEEATALYGALTVDFLMRGLLTEPLPPNAFDEPPTVAGVIDPVLDEVVSSIGDLGPLAVDLKNHDDLAVAKDLATIAASSTEARDSLSQILSKYVTPDQIDNFFDNAGDWLGALSSILDVLNLPEKYTLLKELTTSTFQAPLSTWNRLDAVPPNSPLITSISPTTLADLPSPQTQTIQIFGSGFTSSSTLTFAHGGSAFNSDPGRLSYVSGTELDYNIIVGSGSGNWTVQVVNGAIYSTPASFVVLNGTVTTPPPEPILTVTPSTRASKNNQFYLSWNNPSDPSGIVRVWLKMGSAPSSPTDGSAYPLPAYDPLPVSLPISEGMETVYVWLEDAAGNKSQLNAASATLTVDVTAPVVTITSPTSQAQYSTSQNSISLSGTYSDNLSGVTAMVWTDGQNNGGNVVSQTGTGTSGTWNCTINNLASGLNNISITAVDAAGNVGMANIQVTYLNDSNTGSVNVSIAPPGAASAGGQWQIVGDTSWHNPGTVSGIPVGNQQIQFESINGWVAPAVATVNVQAGLVTPCTGTYTPANVNQPPGPVSNPSPANGAGNVGRVNPVFTFTRGNLQDVLDFQFYLGTTPDPQSSWVVFEPFGDVFGERIQTDYTLEAATTYYWQVNSRDDNTGLETDGPVWSFTTEYMYPDLAVTSLSLDGTVAPGSNATIHATVANLGTFTADAEFVYFYLSRTPGAKSMRLNLPVSIVLNPPLSPGQSTNINYVASLNGLQAGQSYIDASIEPYAGEVVTDPNLGNNLMSIPISYVDDTPPTVGYVGLGSCVCSSNASLKNGITNSIEYWAADDTGVTRVDFYYSTNGGLNWTAIQEGYTPPYAPTYGATYTWPVPTNLPLTAR